MKFRLCALLMATVVLLAGCTPNNVSDAQEEDLLSLQTQETSSASQQKTEMVSEISLAYNASDSLNPYTMQTQLNQELTPLLYDSLVHLDKSFQPQNLLAAEITMGDKLCTVKYNASAQFSDGTRLTGKDIVYSITTATSSESIWKKTLSNIAGCSINADGDVEIRLYANDADFPALLTFPIIKENTAGEEYPTGVSKYYVSGAWNGGVFLSANHLYWTDTGRIEKIRLVGVKDADSLNFNLKTGDIDLAYSDLSTPELTNMSTSSVPVSLNRLVYLGVNANRGWLANENFRQAVSRAINRDELVVNAYISRARATLYPFHPDFYRMQEMDVSAPRSLTEAQNLLSEIGLTQKNDDGFLVQNGSPVTLRLLVNSENASRNAAATLIADQLALLGIKVEVQSQSFSQYQASIAAYDFDLYIGETRLMDNMDLSALLSGGSLAYATAYDEQLQELYSAYKNTGTGIQAFCDAFVNVSPFIPLVYREGVVTYDRSFEGEIVATEQDIFYNIVNW